MLPISAAWFYLMVEEATNWDPPEESKRMFPLILVVAYDLNMKRVLFMEPMIISKGKHQNKSAPKMLPMWMCSCSLRQ